VRADGGARCGPVSALDRAVALGVGDGGPVALGAALGVSSVVVALGTRYDRADGPGLDGSMRGARRSSEKRAGRSS
jgi:hypothetical protein